MGVAYALEKRVQVITAAGDRGDELSEVAAYPAVLSQKYSNVITVASVDERDELVQVSGRYSNFGESYVAMAAPGLKIRVAEPRLNRDFETSSGISAAIVAGAWVRSENGGEAILCDSIPALAGKVAGACRLKVGE